MKNVLIVLMIVFSIKLNAQDNIKLKSGDTIECKIDSIDDNSIYFTIDSDYYLIDFVDVKSYNYTESEIKYKEPIESEIKYKEQPINNEIKNGDSYTASDGHTYYIGDTITMNVGSKDNGDFNYLQMGGLSNTVSILNGDYNNIGSSLGRNFSGLNVIIKKIKTSKLKGGVSTYFVVGGGNITNYNLFIEQAIQTGEIKIKGFTSDGALAELKKFKDKLDLELITRSEYDIKKAELIKYIK